MVKVRVLGAKGHETVEMTVEELITKAQTQKYWVVDEETKKVIEALSVKESQSVTLVPIVSGG